MFSLKHLLGICEHEYPNVTDNYVDVIYKGSFDFSPEITKGEVVSVCKKCGDIKKKNI